MDTPPAQTLAADPGRFRSVLAEQLARWVPSRADELRSLLEGLLASATPAELARLEHRVATTGSTWGYHPPDPLARRISRGVLGLLIQGGSTLEGEAWLETARRGPVLLPGNHLSFVDLNVLDHLLARTPHADVADRLCVVAGPKVYSRPIRRLASLCFGTIKTAQSPSRASGDARMPHREVARISAHTLEIASSLRAQGVPLAIFVEGSRSRSGAMERALPAISRYLEGGEITVIPWSVTGTERLAPPGRDRAAPGRARIRIGRPVPARDLWDRCDGRRRRVMDVIGFLIADLLPEAYRGAYRGGDPALAPAREIAGSLAESGDNSVK